MAQACSLSNVLLFQSIMKTVGQFKMIVNSLVAEKLSVSLLFPFRGL
jgi:hypothetical protein